jgi:hypothetical protein
MSFCHQSISIAGYFMPSLPIHQTTAGIDFRSTVSSRFAFEKTDHGNGSHGYPAQSAPAIYRFFCNAGQTLE